MLRRPGSLATFVLLAAFPLGIQFGDEDSSSTTIGVSGGGGHYAAILENCEGQTIAKEEREFGEAEVFAAYQKRYPGRRAIRLHLGAGAGKFSGASNPELNTSSIDSGEGDFWYIRPGMRFDFSHLGFGLGLLHTSEPLPTGMHDWFSDNESFPEFLPTGTLWVGSLRTVHFDVSFYHDGPLLSSGAVTSGLGLNLGKRFDVWAGISDIGPYSAAGFLLRTDVGVTDRLDVGLQGRIGGSNGLDESSFNLGMAYRLH